MRTITPRPARRARCRQRRIRAAITALCCCSGMVWAADDFQTWQTVSLKWLDTQYADLLTVAHLRITDDSSDFSLWRIGQRVSADPLPWLRAGVGYRYTESENSDGNWQDQHRGEFQLTPHLNLSRRVSLRFRNRLELRWDEGAAGANEVSRHRLELDVSTPAWGPLRAAYVSNEVFQDYDRDVICENRVLPLGLRFRLHERAGLNVFYILRSVRGADDWQHAHVLGTALTFSF